MKDFYQMIADILAFHVPVLTAIFAILFYKCYSRTLAYATLKEKGYPTIDHGTDAYGKERKHTGTVYEDDL